MVFADPQRINVGGNLRPEAAVRVSLQEGCNRYIPLVAWISVNLGKVPGCAGYLTNDKHRDIGMVCQMTGFGMEQVIHETGYMGSHHYKVDIYFLSGFFQGNV